MRVLFAFLLLLCTSALHAQKTIWSHAVGNWRNGPVVYITPVITTTEAFTTPELLEHYRAEFPLLKDVEDLDVLRFGTSEEGDASRHALKAKYTLRKLEVVMLEDSLGKGPR